MIILDLIKNKLFTKRILARKQGSKYVFNRADVFFNCPNCNVKGNLGLEPIINLILICPSCNNHYQITESRLNTITRKISIDVKEIDEEDLKDVKKLYDPEVDVWIEYDKTHFGESNIKLNKLKQSNKNHANKTNID